uniref:Uncharacterized protein n=1 Tax=Rhizophora mucronata TaxID=61149 RepID=A0A2P2Q2G7_RHIMU
MTGQIQRRLQKKFPEKLLFGLLEEVWRK